MRMSRSAAALVSASLALSIACSSGGGSSEQPPPPPAQPALTLSDVALSFTAAAGGTDPASKTVTVTNSGGGTLATPSVSIAYGAGSGWLEAAVTGSSPYAVTAQPRVTGLAAGTYGATVTVDSAGATSSPQTFTVTLTVTAFAPTIALSPGSLTFTVPLGTTAPAAQTVAVTNAGSGTLAAPTTSIAYASGSGWLTAAVSGSGPSYTVGVQPNPTGLAAGTYAATVSVAAAGASNTPQSFSVTFTVVDPVGASPAMQLSSSALSFEAAAGGANPSAQTVTVSNMGGGTLAAPVATVSYGSGSGWLATTVSGAGPYTVSVQPTVGALGAGTYQATISLASTGAANTPQTVSVSFTITAPPQIALSATSLAFTATAGAPSPAAKTVSVSNVGGGTLAVPTTSTSYASGSGWLSVTVSGAAAPYTVSVRAATTSLAAGSYSATVSVASAGATNSPRSLGVALAVVAPPAACKTATQACTSNGECCSSICDGAAGCATSAFCGSPGTPCGSDSDCCSMNCPNAGTAGATCSVTACSTDGESCTSGAQCCSGVCDGTGKCAALPPGPTNATCTTLGERCSTASQCCSQNCQGATGTQGWCAPAYTCNAQGDVCSRPEDCCSGLCAAPAVPGQPGRCADAPGGCGQDGTPCTDGTNCCTRLCVDLGSGTKVCQPAGGCRMTGNYCDSTDACCNVNDLVPPSQRISCTAEHTCDNGGSCNPPGNICGASTDVNASQNCCHDGGGSGKPVCKPDSNGILRCFGGPVTTTCPSGWDGNDPSCCIQTGAVCQFRDQCCGGAPCVPDAAGVLRCSGGPEACVPRGNTCTAASPDPCCAGTFCNESGVCADNFTCLADNAACSTTPATPAESCCSGLCVSSTPGGTTGTCGLCAPNGNSCTYDSQCCSGACDPTSSVCVSLCVGQAGTCTVTADCCAGLTCDVPAGATSGTCTAGGATCASTGQTCAIDGDCCNSVTKGGNETCTGGVCSPPFVCSGAAQTCAPAGTGGPACCDGLSCGATDPVTPSVLVPCTAGDACFCTTCVAAGTACLPGDSCCPGTRCAPTGAPAMDCTAEDSACSCQ